MRSRFSGLLRRRLVPLSIALSAVLLVAACSGAASPAASAPAASAAPAGQASSAPAGGGGASGCPSGALTHFCGHMAVSGGVTKEAEIDASWRGFGIKDCAGWLKGKSDDPTLLDLPAPDLASGLNLDATIQNYKGPGTYDVKDLVGEMGGFQVVVGSDGWTTADASTGSATVNADGSGTIQAMGLQPVGDSNKVQKPIDVSISWTCLG
jgi:hypothetical protein